MKRMVDVRCSACGTYQRDLMLGESDIPECSSCGKPCEQIWWAMRDKSAQWGDKDCVVVFRDPQTGKLKYPPRNDRPTPKGYERVEMRSLREVERFEKDNHVLSEMAWYDKGTSRGHDDTYFGEKVTH